MSIRKTVPIDQAEWQIAPTPDWVIAREPDWTLPQDEHHALSFLLIDEQHHIASQSQAHRTIRRLHTLAAVQTLAQVELDFDPAAHRLLVHELAIWRPDAQGSMQKRSLARRDLFLLRQREQQLEQQMLNGRVSIVALLEDVRVGDAIELAWTLEPRDPMPGLRFTAFFGFVWTVPVARVFVTLHRDPAHPVQWWVHVLPSTDKPKEETVDGCVTWTATRPSVFEPEPNVPGTHWPYALLDVSGWKNWGEVADFAAQLWAEALADGAEAVAADVARLRAETDVLTAARAVIRFVQEEVRYLAIDFGHGGGLLPNGAGTVLRRRFGDCKDKAVLLTAMLRVLGLDASPLLVATSWREAVEWVQPSTAAFSHAIVTFTAEGRRYFVDPTFLGQRGDFARLVAPPYGRGLEVRPGATALLTLPDLPPGEVSLTETFHLDRKQREGRVEQLLRATSWVADDLRSVLLRQGAASFFKARVEALQKNFAALEAIDGSTEVIDDPEANSIELRANYRLPTWGPVGEKPPAMFRYGAHGLSLAIDFIDDSEKREQPWALRFPLKIHHRVVVGGRCVRKLKAEQHRVLGPGFTYVCDVNARRREVAFDYRWETTAREITPAQWPEYGRQRSKAFERSGANVNTQGFSLRNFGSAGVLVWFAVMGVLAAIRGGEHRTTPSRNLPAGPDSADLDREMRTGYEAAKRGDYRAAEPIVERLRPYFSARYDYQLLRADVAIHTGQYSRARLAISAARQREPSKTAPDVLEAGLHEQLGELPAARELLERVLAKSPEDSGALFLLGRIADRMGDADAARQAWEKCLAVSPAQPEVLKSYSLSLWNGGEHDKADKTMLAAVRGAALPSAALEGAAADYLSATDRHTDAVDPAARAARLAPRDPAAAFRYTMALVRSGDAAGAVLRATQMTTDYPQNPIAWYALSTSALSAGQNDVAEKAFHQWIKLAPREPRAHANYGHFLHRTGRSEAARTELEKASRDFPGSGLVWLNLSVVREALGDAPGAAEARSKADSLMTPIERALLLH